MRTMDNGIAVDACHVACKSSLYGLFSVMCGISSFNITCVRADGELVGWLHGCLTTRQLRKVNLCQLRGWKPAQSANKDRVRKKI